MIYIFDLDGTLAESRSRATDTMLEALRKLGLMHTLGVISGAELSRMNLQIPDILTRGFYVMPQSGNVLYNPEGKLLWEYKLVPYEEKEALDHIGYLKEHFPVESLTNEEDTIEHRGSQITYNPLGHNAPVPEKRKFDPSADIRNYWIAQAPKLTYMDAHPAGHSTIDYTAIGRDKGRNIERLMALESFKREDMVFVGDRLHKGGNDETVIGVCKTIAVKNPDQTLELILSWL